MIFDLILLNGYGQFVWPAFIFTFVSCFVLYLKANKELQKQEKVFLEKFEKTQITKIKIVKEKKVLSEGLIF